MNIQNSGNTAVRMSRRLLGGMALMVAAAMTLWAPNASAQPKANFSNGASCNFTTFSYNPTTQTLDIQCTSGTTQPPPTNDTSPSTFTWSGGTTTANTPSVVVLTRGGGSLDQTYTVSFSVVGNFGGWTYPPNPAANGGTATFGPGVTRVELPFNPGGGTGRVWFTPTALTGSPAASNPGVYAFDVTAAAVVNPPIGNLPAHCAAFPAPQYNETFTFGGQKHVFNLKPGEHASVAFTSNGAGPQLSTTETVNTPASADHQVVVSDCPGDFTKPAPCAFESNYIGLSMNTTTGTPSGWSAFYQCQIPLGGRRFMNIRQVVKGTGAPTATPVNSCNQGACEVRAQIQNL
jgi:hypothetical protein